MFFDVKIFWTSQFSKKSNRPSNGITYTIKLVLDVKDFWRKVGKHRLKQTYVLEKNITNKRLSLLKSNYLHITVLSSKFKQNIENLQPDYARNYASSVK